MTNPSTLRHSLPKLVLHRRYPNDIGALIHQPGTEAGSAQEGRIAKALYDQWKRTGGDAVEWHEASTEMRSAYRSYARVALNEMGARLNVR